MTPHQREGFTDCIAGGENHYSWNVIRSEADELIFRHAAKSGAKTFDGLKVNSVEFADTNGPTNGTINGTTNGTANGTEFGSHDSKLSNPGRPISASYTRKEDGTTGVIRFDYIVDASGRAGNLNTKYLQNRHYNTALKNVANGAYYEGTGFYDNDATRRNAPVFEALTDERGWAWFIALHNGTTSVGVGMKQTIATKKKAVAASNLDFFTDSLKLTPTLLELMGTGKRVTEVKSASDYSYHSSSYSLPFARVVGDAGCFIDPFFSSGVHLAMTGGLPAGTTIAASIRGDVDETTAAQWHTSKVRDGYARFLLVFLSAYKQMMHQDQPVLSDYNEDNFDRAFSFFKPGTVDSSDKLSQAEFSKTIDLLIKAFDPSLTNDSTKTNFGEGVIEPAREGQLSAEDLDALRAIRTYHSSVVLNIDSFNTDIVDGRLPKLERGHLTLVQV